MTSAPVVSLVVPTYNEAENIVPFLESVELVLGNYQYEIIVVDDDSPDLTWKKAEEYAHTHSGVRVLRRLGKRDLSSAVMNGFEMTKGSILVVMDADLSHDEKILPALILGIQQGADLSTGSRRIPGGGWEDWPWYRYLASGTAALLAKTLLRVKLTDPMSGYFALKRSLYESCKERIVPMGYKILLEIYCQARPARVFEVPFVFRERRKGQSKLSGKVIREYLQMILRLWKS